MKRSEIEVGEEHSVGGMLGPFRVCVIDNTGWSDVLVVRLDPKTGHLYRYGQPR